MKRRYERPSAYIEEFTPNEYVAACGENGKVYNFQCNAGSHDYYGKVYLETNGKAGLQTRRGMEWVDGKPKFYSADTYLTNTYMHVTRHIKLIQRMNLRMDIIGEEILF